MTGPEAWEPAAGSAGPGPGAAGASAGEGGTSGGGGGSPAGAGEPMLADIRRQPEVLRSLLARSAELAAAGAARLVPAGGGRVYAVGCGDGWFAARAMALPATLGLGLPYLGLGALEFLTYHVPHLTAADRVVAISMSGNVDRTVEAAQEAGRRGASVLALTNGAGGRLGEVAPDGVSLGIPDLAPFLCGTSTYTGMLLTLLLLLRGAAASRQAEGERGGCAAAEGRAAPASGPDGTAWRPSDEALEAALARLPSIIAEADGFARAVAAAAAGLGASGVRILSAGPHLATADYGAAKLAEVTRLPAWSDDIEEFAHRQFWSAPARDLVVYLAPSPALARRADESADALADLGFETVAVESAGTPVARARHRLILPAWPEWLALLATPVPLQLLAYRLALATGLDPNTRAHLRDDAARFRVSRRLTRRSLVGTGR